MNIRPLTASWLSLALLGCVGGCSSTPSHENERGVEGTDQGPPDGAPTGSSQDAGPLAPDAAPAPPRLNSIIPNRGEVSGGTRVLIVGRDFVEGMDVQLGNKACRDLVLESENHLRCTTPPGDQTGAVHLEVRWPGERDPFYLRDGFLYFRAVAIRSVTPDRGPASGGVEVQIDGAGFLEPTEVRFGDVPASSVRVLNPARILAMAPVHLPGPSAVSVRNVNGEATLDAAFVFFEELLVDDLSPRWGRSAGGDVVVLAGAGLATDSVVRFGGVEAEVGEAELDRQRLTVRTPPHAPGPVSLAVENHNGRWEGAAAFLYVEEVDGDFRVDGVAPGTVPVTGGPFLVGGNGFTEATEVQVGGAAARCERRAAQLLACEAPGGAPGLVDVLITEGGAQRSLPSALRYIDPVQIFDVRPRRGAVAGGTVVQLVGSGFVEGMTLTFQGQPLELIEVTDGGTALARTPPGRPGWVPLRVRAEWDEAWLAEAFEYFDPVTRFGGVWGEAIDGAVNVTVLNLATGEPVPHAEVLAIRLSDGARWEGPVNADGQITLSEWGMEGPISITAGAAGFEVGTFERVTQENLSIYLSPHARPSGGGGPRDPLPPSRLTGRLTGLDALEKPLEPGLVLAAFVETTHSSMFNKEGLPWPEPRGILLEDGEFEIFCRPGELAVVATAGYIRQSKLDEYFAGSLAYWQMRRDLTPLKMGIQRFVSISPGEVIEGLEINLDRHLDTDVPVTLENPSSAVDLHEIRVFLDFGPEGYWQLDAGAEGPTAQHRVRTLPDMDEWAPDIGVEWLVISRSETADWIPYVITFESARDFVGGLLIGPLAPTVHLITPMDGSSLDDFRWIEWGLDAGVEGPAEPPDVNVVTIESAAGLPLWTHVTPGPVTRYQLPGLPEDVVPGGLVDGPMLLTVVPLMLYGDRFDYADFSYGDLSFEARRSYSVMSITFAP